MIASEVQCGDWLGVAGSLRPGSIDLVYADPPFNTGASKSTPPNAHRMARGTSAAYADSWESVGHYIGWLRERVEATVPALKQSASVLLHVDWRTGHRVRVMLDEVLGADRFVNHLIWSYGLGGSSARRFARKHDDILFYCVDPELYFFEPPLVPATSARMRGRMKKATDVIEIAAGERSGAGDVLDVPSLNNMALERTGYPTQKPVELLELLVRACCPPGGMVFDPCCGSGTTLVAAVKSGRGAVGCDISEGAVRLARERVRVVMAGAGGRGVGARR